MKRGKDRAGVGARGGSGNAHAQGRQGARSGAAGAGSAAVPALREAPGEARHQRRGQGALGLPRAVWLTG